jgi:heme exporter protein A
MRPVQANASLRGATVILDDRPIIRDVTIDIAPGLTVIRGPNGAGKTTLLRALAGLVPLARGERRIAGDALYIGHRPMLLRGLSARENLSFYARFRGQRDGTVADALARWGLASLLDRPVERLSAGERRRAALARIETEPVPLLFLDEPFADLDEGAARRVGEAIERGLAEGRAVVVATHAHHEIDQWSGARIVMENGVARAA